MLYYCLILIFLVVGVSLFGFVISCLSCLGLTKLITKLFAKMNISSYDRIFKANSQPTNQQCFICLDSITSEVVATCNHSYCAQCIITYIKSKPDSAIDCPACRKTIYVLFRKFQSNTPLNSELKNSICEYNSRNSQQPSVFIRSISQFGNIIKHLPLLISEEGIRYLLTNPQLRTILFMILYTLSPIDLLPQLLLGPMGLIDDAIVSINIIRQLSSLLINFVRFQDSRP